MSRTYQELVPELVRIEERIREIKQMIEADRPCDELLNRIAAAKSALSEAAKGVFEAHLRSCVAGRIQAGDAADAIDPFMQSVSKLLK